MGVCNCLAFTAGIIVDTCSTIIHRLSVYRLYYIFSLPQIW